jgi:hypothetical protein
MKFCTKCGGQCVDEAVICVSCGSALAPAAPTAPAAPVIPSASPLKSGDNKLVLFDFLSNISMLLYVAAFALSIVYAWGGRYFNLEEGFVIVSALLAVPVFVFAILRLVAGLSQKGKPEVVLPGVFRLITAIIMALVSVLAIFEHV